MPNRVQDTTAVSDAAAASGKIRPESALPWEVLGNHGTALWAGDSIVSSAVEARTHQRMARRDALYAAHACNAYPKLVAGLIEARLQIAYLHDKYPPTSTGEASISRLTGLLTELGELK